MPEFTEPKRLMIEFSYDEICDILIQHLDENHTEFLRGREIDEIHVDGGNYTIILY